MTREDIIEEAYETEIQEKLSNVCEVATEILKDLLSCEESLIYETSPQIQTSIRGLLEDAYRYIAKLINAGCSKKSIEYELEDLLDRLREEAYR